MAKYLRYLALRCTTASSHRDPAYDDPDFYAAIADSAPDVLCWQLEHRALPLASHGISKVVIYLTRQSTTAPPEVLPGTPEDQPGEGIAQVFQRFDIPLYQTLQGPERKTYVLDQLLASLLTCASHFGWDDQPFRQARNQILADNFQHTFYWKKPVTAPDRRLKAQGQIEVTDQARIFVVFFDRQQEVVQRVLLCETQASSGIGEFELHRIEWLDSTTVKVTQKNGRDYWLCSTDGTAEFHFPRAERGDPHGEYELGRMFLEGRYVPRDVARGRAWLQQAADKNFAHARRLLQQLDAESLQH